jgi:hypothetical protein
MVALLAVAFATGAALRNDAHIPGPDQDAVVAPTDGPAFEISKSTADPARMIARAYGVDHAHEIEALAFSFNIQYGDQQMRREWYWDVADNRIEYRGEGPTGLPISLEYFRDDLDRGDPVLNRRVDAQFVDDQYWLLFPFHLAWEKDLKTAYEPNRMMYIEPRESECVSVRYPEADGEIYEVFYGPDQLIREWAYRPKAGEGPAFVTTWERHAKAGPVLFSLMHRSEDGDFRVWYDRVAVKLVNEGWVDAEPLERFFTRADNPEPSTKNPF